MLKNCVHFNGHTNIKKLEVIMNNNNSNNDYVIKGKINNSLNEAFKKVLAKFNMSQQDFIEKSVTDFVIKNVNVILEKDTKGSITEK